MRDKNKTKEYFISLIENRYEAIQYIEDRLSKGDIPEHKIKMSKRSLSGHYLSILIARYNLGEDMSSKKFLELIEHTIKLYHKGWEEDINKYKTRVRGKVVTLNQYTYSGYINCLTLLSLALLLNVSKDIFKFLVEIIDKDGVQDFLYEFIIQSEIPTRNKIENENYEKVFHINERFHLLKEIISTENKEISEEMLSRYLDRDWYSGLKGTVLYNQHKKQNYIYNGYWCFAAAAVVRILDLDDSSFRNNSYYPRDLV